MNRSSRHLSLRLFLATFVLHLLCLVPAWGDWYECYPNDWYEASISGAPTTSNLDPGSIYQNTIWFDTIRVWINSQTTASSLKLKVGDIEVIDNNRWEIAIDCYQVYKTVNGDWWAEQVTIYRDNSSVTLENQNLGQTPVTVQTAATGGSNLTLNAEIIEPRPQYSPPVVSLSASGAVTTGGSPQNIQVSGGSVLTLNMSATDPNGNYERTRLWVKVGENGGWQQIYNSTASSGSFNYTIPSSASLCYFKSRATDDTYVESASAIIIVEVTAPADPPQQVSSLIINASAVNGLVSASGSGSLTIYLGESVTISSTATASGWLSEHNIYGYTPGPTLFSIPNGVTTLPATGTTTISARTVTWTPTGAGTHTLYAEAFTGTSPGNRQYGISGWPGYEGGTFGGLPEKRITASVRRNPTGSVQVLDGNLAPLTMENGVVTISQGDTYYIKVSGTDADGDANQYYARVAKPDSTLAVLVDTAKDSGNGSSGSKTFGPYTADTAGDWLYWGHVTDVTARAWDSNTPWNENGNGWWSSAHYTLHVTAVADLTEIDPNTGIPVGMDDSNGNGVPDLMEQKLGLSPSGTNNSIPANMTKEYDYDANNQMTISPERTYTLDPEGNVTGN
ncbi:MAG: hypothetical protein LBM04_06320 [Opitutaceae bacterium]|jgi:hypothetical protein|nr:hypothetical protein [Opitutaceae bacterium]